MEKFLKENKKTSAGTTHTRIKSDDHGVYGGAYTIEDELLPRFWSLYYEKVFEKGESEYLTEAQREGPGPLVIDLDFRQTVDTRIYEKEDIIIFLETVFDEIVAICGPIHGMFPVFVYEKDAVNTTDMANIKDGIHIYIGLSLDKWTKDLLRNRMLVLMSIWDNLQTAGLTNSWDSVIDKGVMIGTTNWPVYMSRKPGYSPYKLRYMYNVACNDGSFEMTAVKVSTLSMQEVLPTMSVRYSKYQALQVLPKFSEEYDRMKSGHKKKIKSSVKDYAHGPIDHTSIATAEQLDAAVKELFDSLNPTIDYKVHNTFNYLMYLPEQYYSEYTKWLHVGFALKNTDPRLFICWVKFSSQWSRFNYGEIDDMKSKWESWSPKTDNGLTWRSVVYWVESDAPEKYEEAKKKAIDYHLNTLIHSKSPVTEYDYAKVLWHMYAKSYVCASISGKVWFEYIDQRWQEMDCGVNLRRKISDLTGGISQMIETKINECERINDEANIKRAIRLRGFLTDLKRTDKKGNIMREACDMFYQKGFVDSLDTKNHILCCANGVFDFSTQTFRKGVPEDLTSKSTNNKYIEDLTPHVSTIEEIRTFMRQLFPDKELRRYMWDHAASVLLGKNKNQTFTIYNGSGSNGKSKFVDLMTRTLQDYKATVPLSLITQKRAGVGGASPEVAILRGIRYAVMQEPSKGDVINEGPLKELTGGDPLTARKLFRDTESFIPQFTLVVCTNTLPNVKNFDDEATWRRIRVSEYKSIFSDRPIDGNPYHFKIDKSIDEKFNSWKDIFLNLLIRRAMITKGIVNDCPAVLDQASHYRDSQDPFSAFMAAKIVSGKDKFLKETMAFNEFMDWWKEGANDSKHPPKKELIDYITKRHGKRKLTANGLVWMGIGLAEDDTQAVDVEP